MRRYSKPVAWTEELWKTGPGNRVRKALVLQVDDHCLLRTLAMATIHHFKLSIVQLLFEG